MGKPSFKAQTPNQRLELGGALKVTVTLEEETYLCPLLFKFSGFPDSSVGKESARSAGDPSSIPGSGRSVGKGIFLGFPGGSAGKESTCNAGDLGCIPGLGRPPGEGKGFPLAWRIQWTI